MAVFYEIIEKILNEVGPASALRERIELAKEQYAFLETKFEHLRTHDDQIQAQLERSQAETQIAKSEHEASKFEKEHLLQVNKLLQRQIKVLEDKIANAGNPFGYVCDHGGCSSLKRIGNRPDPVFGKMGVKQRIFICNDCGKESAFTPD